MAYLPELPLTQLSMCYRHDGCHTFAVVSPQPCLFCRDSRLQVSSQHFQQKGPITFRRLRRCCFWEQVMKKHDIGAIRAFFVGSATEHVAHLCKQPVVVLH